MLSRTSLEVRQPLTSHPTEKGARRFYIAASLAVVVGLALIGLLFQFDGAFGESDLYWVAAGILDGHANGDGAKSAMLYGGNFTFGYYEVLYRILDESVLKSPVLLIETINNIGLFSAVLATIILLFTISLRHGLHVAFVTATLFALSPLVLDLATSGHPILAALVPFFLGIALMFYPSSGLVRAILWTSAGLAFFLSLTIRAEVLLALCWPIVAGADMGNVFRFLRSSAVRAVPPTVAAIAFFVAQTNYPDQGTGGGMASLLDFMQTFYNFRKVGLGVGYLTIGFGVATLVVALACVFLALKPSRHNPDGRMQETFARVVEPAALILPCLAFWLPNPAPARHFLFALLGTALFIGLVCKYAKLKPMHSVLLVCFSIIGNQVIGELLRPAIVSTFSSPYINFPDQPRTSTQAPVGALWIHHASLVKRRKAWDEQAKQLRDLCGRQLIILADEPLQMALGLYGGDQPPRLGKAKFGQFDAISAVRPNGQEYLFVPRNPHWPRDTVPELLANPELASFAIWDVPLSRTIYDRTPVPNNRAARTGCTTEH